MIGTPQPRVTMPRGYAIRHINYGSGSRSAIKVLASLNYQDQTKNFVMFDVGDKNSKEKVFLSKTKGLVQFWKSDLHNNLQLIKSLNKIDPKGINIFEWNKVQHNLIN